MGLNALFQKNYTTISPQLAKQMIVDGAVLIDVRTATEFARGHAPGALNIPVERVGRHAHKLPEGTPIVAICHSGARSAIAARTLAKHGHTAFSVRGGTTAWNSTENPTAAEGEK